MVFFICTQSYMIGLLWNCFALHVSIHMPGASFCHGFFVSCTYLFRATITITSLTVRPCKSGKAADKVSINFMQVAIVGNNRISRIAAIHIFVFKAINAAIHPATIIVKANVFTKNATIITKAVRKTFGS